MSTLSEAEKRKLIRERRAAKFAKGGATDRLNKITGSNNSTLSVASPIDANSSTTSLDTATSSTVPLASSIKSPIPDVTPSVVASNAPRSKRISQSFDTFHASSDQHGLDADLDPDIDDIAKLISDNRTPIQDPLNADLNGGAEPSSQDLEKILQQMFQKAVPAQNRKSDDDGVDTDFFSKMMMQMPSEPGTSEQQAFDPVRQQQQTNTLQDQLKFKKFKAYFTVFRITLILSLLLKFYFSHDLKSSSIKINYENVYAPRFSTSFILLEVFFFIIHFVNVQRYEYHPGEGLISSVLPLASAVLPPRLAKLIKLVPGYLDIYKIAQIDIGVIVLFFGIVSIFN